MASIEERWHELSPLLDAVLEVAPDLRQVWIENHCADPELRAQLHALLRDTVRGSILDRSSAGLAPALLDEDTVAGRRIGAWRILRPIGAGGMASVYLAERVDAPFAQQVAIKILRVGVLDPVEQQRFARERSLLARLEHPHIARLIDGGVTPEGAPYFALEYVDGEPITTWCDARRFGTRARVTLFLDVCDAVHHAHRSLIVHRDLKPSNILVDRDGVVKLLDFGIAKLLGDEHERDATGTEQRRLTPAYAAPEQFTGDPVTTSTDVYALGLLLHELLTGMRADGRADRPLPLASAAVGADSERLARRGKQRASELRRELRGDLDAIVQTALRRPSAQRYDSAAALADELRLHLIGQPVRARADSSWYLLSRFMRRHASMLTGAAMVLAALVLATVFSMHQARVAERAARRAQAVQHFLVDLFDAARPVAEQSTRASVEDLIRQGATKARDAFINDPEVKAELLFVTGRLLRVLGQYDDAEIQLRQARQLEHEQLGYDIHGALRTRRELALLAKDREHLDEAERELGAVLAEQRRVGATPAEQAPTLSDLGAVLSRLGRHDDAIARLREAITVNAALQPRDVRELAVAWNNLGTALARATRDAEAMDAYRMGLELEPEGSVEYARKQTNLAAVLRRNARYGEAQALYDSALAIQRRLLPEDHPDTALTLGNLGVLARSLGQYEISARYQGEALAMRRRIYGEEHPRVAESLSNLSSLAWARNDFAEAERYARASLDMMTRTRGPDHEDVARASLLVADALTPQGRGADAAILAERAVAIRQHSLGSTNTLTVVAILALARARQAAGQTTQARELLQTTLAALPSADAGAPVHIELGRLLLQQDQAAGAKAHFEAALAASSIAALVRVDAWTGLADAEHALGDHEAARRALSAARTLLAATVPPEHPDIQKLDRRGY